MIKIDTPIVVEGKYDKIRLETVVDALIIPTDGFGIFKNKELLSLLRTLAETKGLIVLTDSDSAGFMIRSYLSGSIDNSKMTHVYIPELFGKEKRKRVAGAEGLLGVEGVPNEVIEEAFKKAGISSSRTRNTGKKISKTDLYELGLSGGQNSSEKRIKLLKFLSLPTRISANRLPDVLNMIMTYDEFKKVIKEAEI